MSERPRSKRPQPTCPWVDRALADIDSERRAADRAARATDDDRASDALADAASALRRAGDNLEESRQATASIRDNAEEWEDYAIYLEVEIANLRESHRMEIDLLESTAKRAE